MARSINRFGGNSFDVMTWQRRKDGENVSFLLIDQKRRSIKLFTSDFICKQTNNRTIENIIVLVFLFVLLEMTEMKWNEVEKYTSITT